MAISDRIVIMQDGVMRQVGAPRQIYEHPESTFVASFMGKANFVPVKVLGREGEAAVIELDGRRITVRKPGAAAPSSGEGTIVVRPEAVRLSASGAAAQPSAELSGHSAPLLAGTIERITYFGNIARYEIKSGDLTILAERYNPQVFEPHEEGDAVGIDFEMDSVRILAQGK